MNAAYAPLTFSWRGSHSGGWIAGLVMAMPRKPALVTWSPPDQIGLGAQGGFDLESTLQAFTERIEEMLPEAGSPAERIAALSDAWTFGTVQVGDPQEISGEPDNIVDQALGELSLNTV